MDNLNDNPLLDDDEDEMSASVSKAYGNPLLEDEDDESLGDSEEFALPELEFDFVSSGEVRVPKIIDTTDDDGLELFEGIPQARFNQDHKNNSEPEVEDSRDYDSVVTPVNDIAEIDSSYIGDSLYYSGGDYEEPEPVEETKVSLDKVSSKDNEDGIDVDSLSDTLESLANISFAELDDEDDGYSSGKKPSPFSLMDDDEDEDELRGLDLDEVIAHAIESNASDIHISPDDQVAFTILNDIMRIPKFGTVVPTVTERLHTNIISNVLESEFVEEQELDTSYVVRKGKYKGRRLRLSLGRSFGHVFMVFRVISDVIPTPDELGISANDPLRSWIRLPNGLFMVNGATGTGKSTTLASLVQEIQLTTRKKIETIERPIEYTYGTRGISVVTQREVGKDTRSFMNALDSAMRHAPNVLQVGEVRNRTEVDALIRAAESGHLAISTMHTVSAPATINRIKSLYDGDDQRRVLGSLSDVARGFANQVLVKTPNGKGRFAIREILEVNDEISKMILKGDVSAMQEYQLNEKITMDHELVRAVAGGFCTLEEARAQSSFPNRFDKILKEMG